MIRLKSFYIFSVIYVHSHWLSIVSNSANLHLFKFLLVNPFWFPHRITVLPCHHVTSSPMWDFPHNIGMNHLACPYYCITTWDFPTTALLCEISLSMCYCITVLLHEISLPLRYCITMWDFPTTALPHYCMRFRYHRITTWDFPTTALLHHMRFSPHCYESFGLPLPPYYHVTVLNFPTTTLLRYCITTWDLPHCIGKNLIFFPPPLWKGHTEPE